MAKTRMLPFALWAGAVLLGGGGMIACGGGAPTPAPSTTAPTHSASPTPVRTTVPTTPPTTPATTPPDAGSVTKPISAEQQNATRTASDYLDGQSFSRKGLIKQLAFEGYPTKTATAAVDSLHINWNDQAVKVAKSYLDGQSFSRKGLTGQLEFEGFTHSQAVYGVKKAGL